MVLFDFLSASARVLVLDSARIPLKPRTRGHVCGEGLGTSGEGADGGAGRKAPRLRNCYLTEDDEEIAAAVTQRVRRLGVTVQGGGNAPVTRPVPPSTGRRQA